MSDSTATAAETPKRTLFKVLKEGRSFHNSSNRMEWSQPKDDGTPGDWHEVQGGVEVCFNGLHLTEKPTDWYQLGADVYEAEAEGIVADGRDDRHKVAAKRARLLRKLTPAELVPHGIFLAGMSGEVKSGKAFASGSAKVTASGSAQVTAYDSAQVTASGSAQVTAYDSAQVTAYDSAKVDAKDGVTVVSWWGSPTVKVIERAIWIERGDSYERKTPKVHTAGGQLGASDGRGAEADVAALTAEISTLKSGLQVALVSKGALLEQNTKLRASLKRARAKSKAAR